jgi:hypothetical protein
MCTRRTRLLLWITQNDKGRDGGNIQGFSDMRRQMKSSSQQRAVLVGEYWMIYGSFYLAINVKRERTRAWTIFQYPMCH